MSGKLLHMSGKDFQDFVKAELAKLNCGITRVSYLRLGREAGLSDRYIGNLMETKKPNPNALSQRLIFYVLAVPISNPEHDVFPHRASRGLSVPDGWDKERAA